MKQFSIVLYSIVFIITFHSSSTKPPQLRNFGASCYVNALIQALYSANPLTNIIPTLEFYTQPAQNYQELITAFKSGQQQKIDAALFDFYNNIKDIFASPDTIKRLQSQIFTTQQETPIKKTAPIPRQQTPIKKLAFQTRQRATPQRRTPARPADTSLAKALEDSRKTALISTTIHDQLVLTIARAKNPNFDKEDEALKKTIIASIEFVLALFSSQAQQDAQEFLTNFIELLKGDDNTPTFNAIHDLFFFISQNIESKNQDNGSVINLPTYDTEGDLTYITIENQKVIYNLVPYTTLQQGFEAYFTKDKVQLIHSPPLLVISLNRFANALDQNVELLKTIKISHEIEIPFTLDISQFANEPINPYNLFAVVVHRGESASSGHYIAYVKENNQWYLCNDMIIKNMSQVNVHNEINKDGYILFYQKQTDTIKEEEIIPPQADDLLTKLQKLHALLKALHTILISKISND